MRASFALSISQPMSMSISISIFFLIAMTAKATTATFITNDTIDLTTVLSSLPACAQLCLLPLLTTTPLPCDASNLTLNTTLNTFAQCFCTNTAARTTTSACVQDTCPYADQLAADRLSYALCAGAATPSRARGLEVMAAVLMGVSGLFVGLRAWSRLVTARRFWWDDWLIFAAAICLYVTLALKFPSTALGFGLHSWAVDPDNIPTLLKLFYTTSLSYITTQVLTKLSLLVFYLRVFPQQWFRLLTFGTIAFILIHGLMFLLLIAFQCLPLQSIWDLSLERTCLNQTAVAYAGAAFSILDDLVILVLPIPCVSKLKMGRGKKVSLAVMFSVGSFACITSIIRLNYLSTYDGTDQTWDNFPVTFWSIIEISTAIICACLPSLKPLLARYFPKLLGSSMYGTGTGDAISSISMQQPGKKPYNAPTALDVENAKYGSTARPADGEGEDVEIGLAIGDLESGTHRLGDRRMNTPPLTGEVDHERDWSTDGSQEELVGVKPPGVYGESAAIAKALPRPPGQSWGWLPRTKFNGDDNMI